MPQIPFPRIRMQEFNEFRVRRVAKGALLEEYVDQLLTEPVTPQIERWVTSSEHIAFSPKAALASMRLSNGEQMISVCYFLLTIRKSDVAQLVYGGGL